jgi:hypothetical protein
MACVRFAHLAVASFDAILTVSGKHHEARYNARDEVLHVQQRSACTPVNAQKAPLRRKARRRTLRRLRLV